MTGIAPSVWFPAVRTGTGTDVFTERLVAGLRHRGVRAEITWLPLRAEYAPWTVPIPKPPEWATLAHVNTWLHSRFLPQHLPIVATIHHAIHHPDARAYKGLVRATYHYRWIAPNERRILRHADRLIAVSQFVADTARRTLLDLPMQVIHNGVDTEKFRPGNRRRRTGESFRLLFVGSWMARKGVDLLAPIMRELGAGFELRYTGGNAAESDKPGMPPNMHDVGRLLGDGAVIAAMHNADALLFPSRSEGHPLVAIEAMACGLPVIGMQGSAVAEAVIDGQSGLLCPRDDIMAFADAARALANDTVGASAMINAARNDVVTRFSESVMIETHCEIYRFLVDHQSAS